MQFIAAFLLVASISFGALQTLHIQERTDYHKGKAFGLAGPYERIIANATFTGGAISTIDVLKPRDPAKGNGTLVLLIPLEVPLDSLINGGYTILQISDPNSSNVRDIIGFLRYNGSPFLLGDQPRFLKRTISIVPSESADAVQSGLASENHDEKNRRLTDGIIFFGSTAQVKGPADVRIASAELANFKEVLASVNSSLTK